MQEKLFYFHLLQYGHTTQFQAAAFNVCEGIGSEAVSKVISKFLERKNVLFARPGPSIPPAEEDQPALKQNILSTNYTKLGF
jgi:hypothetical protein